MVVVATVYNAVKPSVNRYVAHRPAMVEILRRRHGVVVVVDKGIGAEAIHSVITFVQPAVIIIIVIIVVLGIIIIVSTVVGNVARLVDRLGYCR